MAHNNQVQTQPEAWPVAKQELAGQSIIIERARQPRGVLLTFHGCGHSALDWWHPQPSCKACTGGRNGLLSCSGCVDWCCSSISDLDYTLRARESCANSTNDAAGLPEETAIVRRAVLRQYTVVAISAADQAGSRCWDVGPPPQQTLDVRRTVASIAMLTQVP